MGQEPLNEVPGQNTMAALTHAKMVELLGTPMIPGTEKEKAVLCIRIGELVALNGEEWVRRNRDRLLDQWSLVVDKGLIDSE